MRNFITIFVLLNLILISNSSNYGKDTNTENELSLLTKNQENQEEQIPMEEIKCKLCHEPMADDELYHFQVVPKNAYHLDHNDGKIHRLCLQNNDDKCPECGKIDIKSARLHFENGEKSNWEIYEAPKYEERDDFACCCPFITGFILVFAFVEFLIWIESVLYAHE
jgi:hypothetical protein